MIFRRAGFRIVVRDIAVLQVVLSGGMLVALVVALGYGELYSALAFALAAAISAGAGGLVYWRCRDAGDPRTYHAMVIAGAGWLVSALFGALPYFLVAHLTPADVAQTFVPTGATYASSLVNFENPLHAAFESMSGYTTAGVTMAVHEPSIGKGLCAYRSIQQWLGGAGMIVLSLAIIPRPGAAGGMQLYGSESAGIKVQPSILGTARGIWRIYTAATAALALFLIVATLVFDADHGFEGAVFDSINHAMTGIATGGYSPLDDNIASYGSYAVELAHLAPMIVGTISLPLLYFAARDRDVRVLWRDLQFRMMVGVFAIGAPVMCLILWGDPASDDPVREGLFQFVSGVSTTGWQTSNIGAWGDAGILWIVWAAMFVGGASGSTVGGIKLIRAYLIFRAARWRIQRVFLPPEAVVPFKIGERTVPSADIQREVAEAAVFTFLYLVVLVIAMLLTAMFVAPGYTLADILFECVSVQTSTGMSTGITDPGMSPVIEVTFMLQMWIGRLEIFPVIILIRALFSWHRRHSGRL